MDRLDKLAAHGEHQHGGEFPAGEGEHRRLTADRKRDKRRVLAPEAQQVPRDMVSALDDPGESGDRPAMGEPLDDLQGPRGEPRQCVLTQREGSWLAPPGVPEGGPPSGPAHPAAEPWHPPPPKARRRDYTSVLPRSSARALETIAPGQGVPVAPGRRS
jgi:hypothetical protein